jgi:hypothetical protein
MLARNPVASFSNVVLVLLLVRTVVSWKLAIRNQSPSSSSNRVVNLPVRSKIQ